MAGQAAEIIEQALKEGRKHLLEPEAKAVCAEYGSPCPVAAWPGRPMRLSRSRRR